MEEFKRTIKVYKNCFGSFIIPKSKSSGSLRQDNWLRQHLAHEQLAERVGTTKNYISRIENGASDIRLSTLMRIINEGLGGHLKLSLEI